MLNNLVKSISYSAYRDYLKCPRLYYYRRVMKLKLPFDPIQLVLGKSFHLALELLEKEKKDPVSVFATDFTKDKVTGVSMSKFMAEREEALRLLSFWSEHKDELLCEAGIEIDETERRFEIKVDKDPLTGLRLSLPPITGVVDYTEKLRCALGDYKTSSKKYSQEMVDESDQPTFYYLWYLIEKGKLPDVFSYIVFRKGIKRQPIQILTTTRTLTQVSNLLSSMQRVVMQIENREFTLRHKDGEFCDCGLYEDMLRV